MQYSSGPQPAELSGSQELTVFGHAGPGAPAHDAGSSGLPTHSSHSSHGFLQSATGVQGRHNAGSALVESSQSARSSPEPSQMKLPLPAGSSQQPKQSQPFGVSGKQFARHAESAAPSGSHVASVGAYSHMLRSVGGKLGATEPGSQRYDQLQPSSPEPELRSNEK